MCSVTPDPASNTISLQLEVLFFLLFLLWVSTNRRNTWKILTLESETRRWVDRLNSLNLNLTIFRKVVNILQNKECRDHYKEDLRHFWCSKDYSGHDTEQGSTEVTHNMRNTKVLANIWGESLCNSTNRSYLEIKIHRSSENALHHVFIQLVSFCEIVVVNSSTPCEMSATTKESVEEVSRCIGKKWIFLIIRENPLTKVQINENRNNFLWDKYEVKNYDSLNTTTIGNILLVDFPTSSCWLLIVLVCHKFLILAIFR